MPTRNRKADLRRAIESCMTQTVPVEVIVRDDGSTDGTDEMMRAEFAWVDYSRNPSPRGSIVNRNIAVRAARTNIIVSLDDDAAFGSPGIVEATLRELDHPRVGAVAMPYVDVNYGDQVLQQAPDSTGIFALPYFRGCAAAWRRDVFLAVGGYSEVLFHMAEEPDLCMRLLNAGYITRLGTANPVLHYESPNRDPRRIVSLIVRNGVLMGVLNAPGVMLPVHILGSALRSLISSVPRRHVPQTIRGLWNAAKSLPTAFRARKPLRRDAYFLFRHLVQAAPLRLEEFEDQLPPAINPSA